MSTTFGAPKTIRDRSPKQKGAATSGHYTAARRQAREAARKRSVKTQIKTANHLLSKDTISKVRSARWPFLALFATIGAAAVIALLMLNTATVQSSFTQRTLNKQLTDLTVKEQALQEQVTAKDASSAIAQKATQQGMVAGNQPGYLVINPDGTYSYVEPKPQKTPVGTATAPVAPAPANTDDPENPAAAAPSPAPADPAPAGTAPAAPAPGATQ